ncbi:unnamed protein product [Umbelopsis sp. WA50703]
MDEQTDGSQTDAARFVQRQAINRSGCYMLLFFFSLLFLNFEEDNAARIGHTIEHQIEGIEYEKSLLANITFGENITNPTPPLVQQKIDKLLNIEEINNPRYPSTHHFYHNVTGIFRGDWTSQNLTSLEEPPIDGNQTTLEVNRGEFPYDQPGSFTFNMKSDHTKEESVKYIDGYLRLQNEELGDFGVLLVAEGVHFVNNGTLYMTAVPDGAGHHIPYEDLLHMLPSNNSMNVARDVIQEQLDKELDELRGMLNWAGPASSNNERPAAPITNCTFELWIQLKPVPPPTRQSQLLEYEKELENPQGISVISAPPLLSSMVVYSENCGLLMEVDDAKGTKIEKYYKKAINYATLASVVTLIQVFLLIHQMEYTPTPSTRNGEGQNDTAENETTASGRTTTTTSTLGGLLPIANTPVRRAVRTAQDERREDALLYYRFYLVFLFGLFLFYQTASKSAFVQNIVVGMLAFSLFSFWVPQIYRNVIRGSRRALSHRYVIGMTLTRLVIPLYYYACPHNILAHQPTKWVWVLSAYLILQAAILLVQDMWDPRFFVPERYLPARYNYHPILPTDDEEAIDVKVVGVNASEEAESSERVTKHSPGRDCAICMLPVDPAAPGPAGLHALVDEDQTRMSGLPSIFAGSVIIFILI